MGPDKILVLIGAGGLVAGIYWWFLGKRETGRSEVVTEAQIKVEGGYSPALVKVPAGKKVSLTFTRTDPTDCLEEIVIPDLKIKRSLPLNEPVEIEVVAPRPGTYDWHCGMNMFFGKVVAV